MKLLMSTLSTAHTRNTRKVVRVVSKRPNSLSIPEKGSKMLKSSTNEFCDNSNDSGLDLESQEIFNWSLNKNDNITDDFGLNLIGGETNDCSQQTNFEYSNDSMSLQNPMKDLKNSNSIINSGSSIEYPILRINNDTNIVTNSRNFQRMSNQIKKCNISTTLNSQLNNISKNGKVELKIVNQPEKQHRARYQTEGSRGAIKDRSGNGFPAVKLIGYTKPIVLQVFIGTDVGRVGPHMFYQACRITGKNSKICEEMKVGGTAIIMLTVNDVSENPIVCDYVGILKERNVDVEQRFPEQTMPRNKKKSTRCRMVFRTTITNDDGTSEKLQVCSEPIVCTQPPGVPEICIASLESSAVTGGCRLFIVGKNFLKDSQIVFQECDSNNKLLWEEHIVPNKEYFHQSHLICTVPSYHNPNITKPVNVQFFVLSSGKASEPHNFVYTPNGLDSLQKNGNCQSFPNLLWQSKVQTELGHGLSQKSELVAENKNVGESASNNDVIDFCQGLATSAINTDALKDQTGNGSLNDSHRLLLLKPRFVLLNGQIQVNKSFHDLVNMKSKNCLVTSNIGNSDLISGLVNLPTPSLDTIKQFVVAESSNIPLPAQSGQTVENYFSDLASNAANSSNGLLLNKSMQTASTVSSDAFMSETNSQSLFPILSDSELKSSRHGMHDSIMHETGKSIMLSNLMQNSTDTSISSNSEVTSASLLQSTLNENIMLIETQTPILELSNNNLLSNENFNSNSSNLLLSTTTTESPTSHDRLLLSGSPSSKMAVHDSKNIRDLLSVANNSGRNQFVSFDSTNSMLGLASDNGISSNSTLLAISNAGDSGLSIVKKENDVVLTHDFSRISDTDFINYINANCFSNLNSSP